MYLNAIVGIDTEGRYVVVHYNKSEGVPEIRYLEEDLLDNIGSLYLKDMTMDLEDTPNQSSLVSSFKDNLTLVDTAEVEGFKEDYEGITVEVDMISYEESYSEYIQNKIKTRFYDSEITNVFLKEVVEEEW